MVKFCAVPGQIPAVSNECFVGCSNREIYRENSRFALVRTMAASIHDFDQLVAAKFPARSEQGIFRGKQGLLKMLNRDAFWFC
jgi:hypothetical protein